MHIGVAGMVGIGKSTLARRLGEHLGFALLLESVGEDNPWLDAFYASEDAQRRYGFHLQTHFLLARMRRARGLLERGRHYITDSVADADAEIFARGLHDDGKMSDMEWRLYRQIYDELMSSPAGSPPDVLLYLHAPIEEVLRRIRSRGRPSEQEVPLSYWERLHDRYEAWAASYTLSPIVRLDVREIDVRRNPRHLRDIAERIRDEVGPRLDEPDNRPAYPRVLNTPALASA